MAVLVQQDPDLARQFRYQMAAESRRRRVDAVESFEQHHPIVGPLMSPFKAFQLWNHDADSSIKGHEGESAVARALRRLPDPWHYLNYLVYPREGERPLQVDHLAVGRPGVVVIETKKWAGAFRGYRDEWQRKVGDGWVRCESPTRQNRWHADHITRYLRSGGIAVPVHSAVVLVDASWVRENGCRGRVYAGVHELTRSLREMPNAGLAAQQCGAIARMLARIGTDGITSTSEGWTPGREPPGGRRGDSSVRQATRVMTSRPPQARQHVTTRPPAAAAPMPSGARTERVVGLTKPAPATRSASSGERLAAKERTGADEPATPKQREYAQRLLTGAGVPFSPRRLEALTRGEVQAVIDRLQFRKDTPLPDLGE